MSHKIYCEYLSYREADLFTVICLPDGEGKFPTVIFRTPYVKAEDKGTEEEVCQNKYTKFAAWVEAGFAVISQQCRGTGRSGGEWIPYDNEHDDGHFLQDWVRKQPFYNGEIYLCGGSYTAAVHYQTFPVADDIKGAVLEVKDDDRYNASYRNGMFKAGFHGTWMAGMYQKKHSLPKSYAMDAFRMLPLSDFSKAVFGEPTPYFDEMLRHPDRDDPYWQKRENNERGVLRHANIPILFVTGFYDIQLGGMLDMWRELDESTREKCAIAIHPFGHSGMGEEEPINFEGGCLKKEKANYSLLWIKSMRGECEPPFTPGKVTYYELFENAWHTDDFFDATEKVTIPLGEGEVSYRYNPFAPAKFQGGLSCNFSGNEWQDAPNSRYDIISIFTPEFTEDTLIKGKMRAKLTVRSDCEDTCFYLRLSTKREGGYYGLRDDIQKISSFDKNYLPGGEVELSFTFDEHAFLMRAGESIRIDISSSAWPFYVPHTNTRGLFSEQTTAKVATNTVVLSKSQLTIPIA